MTRVGRDEVEAAYFTLLRAREEVSALRRYGDYLESEQRRIQRFVAEGDALDAHVDARLRRRIAHTDEALAGALRDRLESIRGELDRLPKRVEAAAAFVAECEHDLERLRRAG
jgi:hypothetical protein